MRKRIAVMLALAMILGTLCAFAEEEEETEDLTGGWELYVGGESQMYVYLERDGTFQGVSSEDTWDRDSITEGTWTYDGTDLTLTAENETITFTCTLPDGCETGGVFAGEKDGIPISFEEIDTDERFDVFRLGQWRAPEDPAMTPERQALFDRGMEDWRGSYALIPRLYMGCWGKDGTNHAFLCQTAAEEPDDKPDWDWELVFMYELNDSTMKIWSTNPLDLDDYCIFNSNG